MYRTIWTLVILFLACIFASAQIKDSASDASRIALSTSLSKANAVIGPRNVPADDGAVLHSRAVASPRTYVRSAAASGAANAGSSACDLAPPYGTIDSSDVQAAANMALGISPCTANIAGSGVCNVVVVQRVVNASLPGGLCVTGYGAIPHLAKLNWTASTSQNLTNYKVYRSTTTGGPYSLLSTLGLVTNYTDYTVQAGQTYYYATTVVDSSGVESAYSNTVSVSVPTP
jgi:hypothetical protein